VSRPPFQYVSCIVDIHTNMYRHTPTAIVTHIENSLLIPDRIRERESVVSAGRDYYY
jgi:hypothetical protein